MKKWFALFLLATSSVLAIETATVAHTDGVPYLAVDGQPVRARFFFGNSGTRPLLLTGETQTFTVEFSPTQNAQKRGTVHFRFGKDPGTLEIQEFSLVDVETGEALIPPCRFESMDVFTRDWSTWDRVRKGTENGKLEATPGRGLVVTIPENVPVGTDFHIFHKTNLDLVPGKTYRVTVKIRSDAPRKVQMRFYRPGNPYVFLGGTVNLFYSQIGLAEKAGANFVSFSLTSIWPNANGEIDWAAIDGQIEAILEAHPNVWLVPRITMNPPQWWLDKYPEEKMVWEGNTDHNPYVSVSSRRYREWGVKVLADVVRHLEAKYGKSIAGYHPCGQNTGEWFTYDGWKSGMAGYGVADRTAWQAWLTEKYVTNEAIQKAWSDSTVTLTMAEVPTYAQRQEALKLPLLEPEKNPKLRPIVDWNFFLQDQMSETVCTFAHAVREATVGKKLVLFFYGYSFEFGNPQNSSAYTAHYGLRKVLNSPDVDILCSPMSYFDRQAGGSAPCMLPAESVTLAGKMYLYEDDTRTYLTPDVLFPGWESGATTLDGTRELLLRNTAETAVRNFATWWMDLGASGWYDSPQLWEIMRKLEKMDAYFLEHPTPYTPEVGVFLDEAAVMRLSNPSASFLMLSRVRKPLGRVGTSYGQYLFDDLRSGRVKAPKVCVLLHPQCFTVAEKAEIETLCQGSQIVWVDSDGLTLERLEKAVAAAGVHRYATNACNAWANGPYLVLHASQDGDVHVSAKNAEAPLYDFMTGEKVSENGRVVLSLKLGETRVLISGTNP